MKRLKKTNEKNYQRFSDRKMVIGEQTEFAVVEAYKMARTNLIFSLSTLDNRIVAVTSSLASEGKSTSCVNTALVLAQTGVRVLIIDADLRRPNIHHLLALTKKTGLTDFLSSQAPLQEVVAQNVRPHLDVIPAGRIPPNPAEMLGSARMRDLLSYLREHYDYILIDTPPAGLVSDALTLSESVAGYLMVVQEGMTHHCHIEQTLTRVKMADGKVLGIIRLGCRDRGKAGGYRYKGKYAYGHYAEPR